MQGLRLGTRGSPLALAQARKVAAAIETAQRWPDGYVEIVDDQDHRRQGPGPAAGRDRRQGAVDQGARPRAARRRGRFLRPFDEGRRKRPARATSTSRRCARAATSATGSSAPSSIDALKQGAVVGTSSPRRKAQLLRLAPRPQDRADPRQCRNPARARSRRARSTRPCSPRPGSSGSASTPAPRFRPKCMLPAPGQAVIGDGMPHQRHATPKRADQRQQPDHLSIA